MIIGIDDTDSVNGMCTTYIGTLIVEAIKDIDRNLIRELPRLLRLNPNNPYKTRGNGAVSIRVRENIDPKIVDKIKSVSFDIITKYSESGDNTNPAIVFLDDSLITKETTVFAERALHEMLSIEEAISLLNKIGAEYEFIGNGRGLIGALASCALELEDFTYELIVYRSHNKRGKKVVSEESAIQIEKNYSPRIFSSYDFENNRMVISPHSDCPILYGLRGESPDILLEAANQIKSCLLYTSDAADDLLCVDLGGRSFIKKKKNANILTNPQATEQHNIVFFTNTLCIANLYSPPSHLIHNIMHND